MKPEEGSKPARIIWLKELSSLGNVVVARCARILATSAEELQKAHGKEFVKSGNDDTTYARSLLEFCCLRALTVATKTPGYFQDKQFRRLTFDMMLAWEAPNSAYQFVEQDQANGDLEKDVNENHVLFYSTLMPLLIDLKSSVCQEAFVELAPAISGVADVMNAYRQFDALARPSGGRLPFSVYNKYLIELDKALQKMRKHPDLLNKLSLKKGEVLVEFDVTAPVTQRIGVSTLQGYLALTNRSLYFQPLEMSCNEYQMFDLSSDVHHDVRPCLNGPWGLPLFDKAIVYMSDISSEQVVFDFPEFLSCSHRDYWVTIIREVICAHNFVKRFQLGEASRNEVLSRLVLGIARLQATKETLRALPHKPRLLLSFSLSRASASEDLVLRILAIKLRGLKTRNGRKTNRASMYAKSAMAIMLGLGLVNSNLPENLEDIAIIGGFSRDEVSSLNRQLSKKLNRAQHSQIIVVGEKADNLYIHLAIMKVLFNTLNPAIAWLNSLQSWEEPFKTIAVMFLGSFIIIREFLQYALPLSLLALAIFIIFFKQGGEGPFCGEVVVSSSCQSNVDQVMELQQLLLQIEEWLMASNKILLRIRALLYSVMPRVTDQVILSLIILAVVFTVLPPKVILLLIYWEILTRHMPIRQEATGLSFTRLQEWWSHVPVVPISFIAREHKKKAS